MAEHITTLAANDMLQCLVGKSFQYGIKSQGCELYDFGFGELINVPNSKGEDRTVCLHTLHVTCRFKVISKNRERRIDRYFEDTLSEEFHVNIQKLVGLYVKRIALSDKNDLWLDLEDYWVVFATFEDGEESWRYFSPGSGMPHIVASDLWICLE